MDSEETVVGGEKDVGEGDEMVIEDIKEGDGSRGEPSRQRRIRFMPPDHQQHRRDHEIRITRCPHTRCLTYAGGKPLRLEHHRAAADNGSDGWDVLEWCNC